MQILNQQEWYEKLKGWVPEWIFERDINAKADFMALAKILAEQHASAKEHLEQTFIIDADGDVLDLHGYERGITRVPSEADPSYSIRIRHIINQSNCPAIKALVDKLLVNPECTIIEDYNAQIFCNRENFINRNTLLLSEIIKDVFTILVPKQIHAPYSFYNRENFSNREDFIGQYDSIDSLFAIIIAAVNAAKAAGVLYRIIELAEE